MRNIDQACLEEKFKEAFELLSNARNNIFVFCCDGKRDKIKSNDSQKKA